MNGAFTVLCGSLCQNIKWSSLYLAHDLPVNFLCCKCKVFRFPVEVSTRSDGFTKKKTQSTVIGVFPENVSPTRRDEMKGGFRNFLFFSCAILATHCRLIPLNDLTSSKTNEV